MPAQKTEVVLKVIRDVYFYYTQLLEPVLTKNAKDAGKEIDPANPNKNCEYTLKVAMTYEEYRALKKEPWAKGCSNFPKAKEFTVEEFEKAFHADGGMPDFGDAEEVVLVKFSQKAQSAKGKDMQAPKILGIKGKVQDRHGETVSQETSLGNGTKGHLQVRPVEFDKYDPYLYPHKVVVTDLVVYEGGGGVDDSVGEDDLGFEELDEADLENMDKVNDALDEFDDDIPF